MGARDGATQGVVLHMIYDASSPGIQIYYSSNQDHKLILGTHNKQLHLCSLDGRPRDALNRKNVEVAIVAPSSCITCTVTNKITSNLFREKEKHDSIQ